MVVIKFLDDEDWHWNYLTTELFLDEDDFAPDDTTEMVSLLVLG